MKNLFSYFLCFCTLILVTHKSPADFESYTWHDQHWVLPAITHGMCRNPTTATNLNNCLDWTCCKVKSHARGVASPSRPQGQAHSHFPLNFPDFPCFCGWCFLISSGWGGRSSLSHQSLILSVWKSPIVRYRSGGFISRYSACYNRKKYRSQKYVRNNGEITLLTLGLSLWIFSPSSSYSIIDLWRDFIDGKSAFHSEAFQKSTGNTIIKSAFTFRVGSLPGWLLIRVCTVQTDR